MPSSTQQQEKAPETQQECSPSIVVHALEGMFASYGSFVGHASATTLGLMIAAVVAVIGAMGSGMAMLMPTADSEFLYTPINSQAHKDREILRDLFPFNASSYGSFLVYRSDRGNAWTAQGIAIANELHAFAQTIHADVKGETVGLEDVCERGSTGRCAIDIPMGCMQQWSSNNSYVPSTDADARVSYPVCVDMTQESGLFVPLTLGNPTLAPSGGSDPSEVVVAAAEAIRITYHLSYSRDDEYTEERSAAWELEFTAQLGSKISSMAADGSIPAGWGVTRLSDRSLDDALEESVGGDFLFISLTFVLMICLVSAISFSRNVVRNKSVLSLAAVTATGIAIPAAFGICSYIGLPFVSIVGVSPFLLLALGIDNGLVIMATYARTPVHMSAARRMELTLRDAGVAITLTTTTDVIAFALGSISPFNAVKIFCAYTGVGIFLAYLNMLFFFVPVMVLDARREEAGISSWTCMRVEGAETKQNPASESTADTQASAASSAGLRSKSVAPHGVSDGSTDSASTTGSVEMVHVHSGRSAGAASQSSGASVQKAASEDGSACSGEEEGYVGQSWDKFFSDVLAPAVLSTPGKIIIVVVWLTVLGVSAWGFSQLEQGLELQQLAPNGHYFIKSRDNEVEFFNLGIPFQVLVPTGAQGSTEFVDYAKAATRSAVSSYGPAIVASDGFAQSSDAVWTDAFSAFLAAGSTDLASTDLTPAQFRERLHDFLADSSVSGPVLSSLSLRDPRDGTIFKPVEGIPEAMRALQAGVEVEVAATLIVVRSRVLAGDKEQADAMVSLRDTIADEARALEAASGGTVSLNSGNVLLAQEFLVFFEQYLVIVSSTITTVGLAAVSILAVAALLLPRIKAVGIVVFALVSIFVMLFGFMTAVDIRLNTVSAINLVLAIGLSVDAVAHVTHAFLTSPGNADTVDSKLSSKSLAVVRSASRRWEQEPWIGGDMRIERAKAALEEMGRPVFQGGLSSLLGLVLLYVGASSYIFTVFASLLIAVILLGLLHAMFVLPVLLSLFGPGPVLVAMDEDEEEGGPAASDSGKGAGTAAGGSQGKSASIGANASGVAILSARHAGASAPAASGEAKEGVPSTHGRSGQHGNPVNAAAEV